ncbi:MAG: anti-sigma factor [Candidatus Eiseniibacteriota bacterium]|jgi:anti-sigma factor RsiW
MSCRATRSNFSAYIESELSEADRRRVREHLEICADCARELEALKKTMTLLRWIPPVEASDGFATEVMVRVRAERMARPRVSVWERLVGWWERVRPAMPWDGLELPVPALASAGALGLVAGVLLTLQLLGMPVGVADTPQLPGELAALGGAATTAPPGPTAGRNDAALVATSGPAQTERQAFRSDLRGTDAVWMRDVPAGLATRDAVGRVAADDRLGVYGPDDGTRDYGLYGWSGPGYAGQQLEGPAPVAVVEYVLQRVHYPQPRQPGAQGVPQLPVGLRVENGYVTF